MVSERRAFGHLRLIPRLLSGTSRRIKVAYRVEPRLSRAKTDQEVIDAFVQEAQPYAPNFMPSLANLVFRTLREPKFPKRRTARMNFLADSLAGLGLVAPRSSRDICQKERIREKRAHHILRYEFY